MPCFEITYNHSSMKPDYVGKALKFASNEDEAVGRLTKSPKTSTKSRVVLDKYGSTLTIKKITEL